MKRNIPHSTSSMKTPATSSPSRNSRIPLRAEVGALVVDLRIPQRIVIAYLQWPWRPWCNKLGICGSYSGNSGRCRRL